MRPGGIFETVLYAEDLAAAERFYRDAVGLQVIVRGEQAVVFRCGDGVLLVFDPRKSGAAGREVPSHGTSGAGHIAFTAKPEDLSAWRKQLHEAGVSIELEMTVFCLGRERVPKFSVSARVRFNTHGH